VGDHRARRTPWTVLMVCWYHGHEPRPTGLGWWSCDRCDRVIAYERAETSGDGFPAVVA
jgi:hypothetical protein